MTLGDFLNLLANSPEIMLFYFIALPLTAFLAGIFGRNEGHISPWKYLYSGIVYLAVIPGIFTVVLNVYLFLFERQSIFNAHLYTQIFPILCMILTLYLVNRNVSFSDIPGFGKLSGLMMMLLAIIAVMWICDKTQIIAIAFMPFQYVLLIFLAILLIFRFGWSKIFS